MDMFVVAGTQAADPKENKLYVMKWSKLTKTKDMDNSDSEDEDMDSDDDDDDDMDPILEHRAIPHENVGVNRIRAMPQAKICSTWGDDGVVRMWNINKEVQSLDSEKVIANPAANKPLFSFKHETEGYALGWNRHTVGSFASGDNAGKIRLWSPVEGGWKVDDTPFTGHTGSVEDLEWKLVGDGASTTFATCGTDGTCQIWDAREANRTKAAIKFMRTIVTSMSSVGIR